MAAGQVSCQPRPTCPTGTFSPALGPCRGSTTGQAGHGLPAAAAGVHPAGPAHPALQFQ